MRRFFNFNKSSASNSSNSSPPPSAPLTDNESEKAYRERPPRDGAKVALRKTDGTRDRKGSVLRSVENEDSHVTLHRRSYSFSSAGTYPELGEGHFSSRSRSPSVCGNPPPIRCCPPTMEGRARVYRGDPDTVRQFCATENVHSPSSRDHNCSSSSSPYSSPIPLRCRAPRLSHVMDNNSTLDLYIDGEQQEINEPRKVSQTYLLDNQEDVFYDENTTASCLLPHVRALSTAPSSPICSQENLRSYSFSEAGDSRRHPLTREQTINSPRLASPRKQAKQKSENLLQAFRKKSMSSRDCDSETTTTVEDIYIDSSDPQPISTSTSTSGHHSTDSIIPYESIYNCHKEGQLSDQQSCLYGKGSASLKNDSFLSPGLMKQKSDEELIKKLKEVEEMLTILSDEDLELGRLQTSTINISALLRMTRNIAEGRRHLAFEFCSHLKSQIAERSSTREGLKQAKFELDTRTRRLQQEKNELQSSLEKELDRRSTDWSLKLEKFQSEEQRLRDRVRELAEQNVSLQREISSLKGNEEGSRSRIMNSEMQLNNLTSTLEESRTENDNLNCALGELQERFNAVKEDLDSIRQSYKVTEKESSDLKKVVVRLQKVCNEQEKTINGLRQGYANEIGKQSMGRDEKLSMLQMEQVRLTGVEQMLRKEIESCRNELESLRHVNMCLLNRLQGNRSGTGLSSVKLDQEIHERVSCLQTQGLMLLNEHSQLFIKFLDLIKFKQTAENIDGYLVGEYTLKYQNLRRGIDAFRRSLLTVPAILAEKSNTGALNCHSETAESNKVQIPEDELEHELKAESLLTRLLREKLCSKELELEQLQSDFASSVRVHDVLQSEIQRLKDELSFLAHKAKDMELQMITKDESVNQLQQDLQECRKELTATRSVLRSVSDERDHIWEEVKHSKETIMLLNLEVDSLKKKIDALDEHVLIKEGEISILRDSLVHKPYDDICSPKSVKDFDISAE